MTKYTVKDVYENCYEQWRMDKLPLVIRLWDEEKGDYVRLPVTNDNLVYDARDVGIYIRPERDKNGKITNRFGR